MHYIKLFIYFFALILLTSQVYFFYALGAQTTTNIKNSLKQDIKETSQELNNINKEINMLNQQLSQKIENKELINSEIDKLRKKINDLNQNYSQTEQNLAKIKQNLQTSTALLETLNDELFANKTNRNLLFTRALTINQISDLMIIIDKDTSLRKFFLVKLLISNLYPQVSKENLNLSKDLSEIKKNINHLKQQEKLSYQATINYDLAFSQYNQMVTEKEKLSILSKANIKKLQDQVEDLSTKSSTLQELIVKLSTSQKLLLAKENKQNSKYNTTNKTDFSLNQNLTKLIKDFPSKGSKKVIRAVKAEYVSLFGKVVDGMVSKAISFKLDKKEHIFAPFDGVITFSDNFKDLGNLIIISHKQEYFSVLYGLDEITNKVGQWVLKGEVVGYASSQVFQELRLGSEAVNPKDFISN